MSDPEYLDPEAVALCALDAVCAAVKEEGSALLVGDRFTAFAVHTRAATVSSFAAALADGAFDCLDAPVYIELGQGIDEGALTRIDAAIARRGLSDRILLSLADLPKAIAARVVHKRDPRNVLIADFGRNGDHEFGAVLRIHNDGELLLDHVTGLHVQGMVLVEAARQMFLAACELSYLRRWPGHSYAYLLTGLDSTFKRAVFPVAARLRLTMLRAETEDPDQLEFLAEVQARQCGNLAMTTMVECSVRAAEQARRHERNAAAKLSPLPRMRHG